MSSTNFVLNGGLPLAQSFKPCHIFGDGDIYGKGVRISYYLNIFAAIVALIANLDFEISQSIFVLTIISLASFINLCVNSTGDNLVILDWVIVLYLTCFLPVYAIWRPLHHSFNVRRAVDESEINDVDDRARPAIEAFWQIEWYGFQLREELTVLESESQLWIHYTQAITAFYAAIHITPPTIRASSESILVLEARLADYLSNVLGRDQTEIDKLRELAFSVFVGKVKQEYRAHLADLSFAHLVAGQLSYGCVALVWSAYMAVLPWLFFFGIHRGRKTGCNIKTMEMFFAPISIYNRGHVIALQVFACIAVLGAASGVYLALRAFRVAITELSERGQKQSELRRLRKEKERISATASTQADATAAEADEDEAGISEPHETKEDKLLRYIRRHATKEEWGNNQAFRQSLYWLLGLPVCLIALTSSMILVEFTIHQVNHIDLSNSFISSPSQLFPLLISTFSAAPIFYKALDKAVFRHEYREERFKADFQHLKVTRRKVEKKIQQDEEN